MQTLRKCDGWLCATQKLPPIANFIISPPTGVFIINNARTHSKGHDARRAAMTATSDIRDHVAKVVHLVLREETVSMLKNEYDNASAMLTDIPDKQHFPEQLTKHAAMEL